MSRDPADRTAYKAIPESYLECILTRRHTFPLAGQRRQHVRIQYGPAKTDVLELTEYVGTCALCGTRRTLLRDRYTNAFVSAGYEYPDGYMPAPGIRWDRGDVWDEYNRRHPVKGRARVVDRVR